MSLPITGFSLLDVKNEIVNNGGSITLPFGLRQAIEIAGKTSVWNKLSDFSSWAYVSDFLDISSNDLCFDYDGGTQIIQISSSPAFTVSNNLTWISFSISGNNLNITCTNYIKDRSGTITIVAGSITKYINISQLSTCM